MSQYRITDPMLLTLHYEFKAIVKFTYALYSESSEEQLGHYSKVSPFVFYRTKNVKPVLKDMRGSK